MSSKPQFDHPKRRFSDRESNVRDPRVEDDVRAPFWNRVAGLWPYVLIVVSLVGLAYRFWMGSR
jgi:hypothetical protein